MLYLRVGDNFENCLEVRYVDFFDQRSDLEGGNVYMLELKGYEIKLIVITAIKDNKRLNALCRVCQQYFQVKRECLGSEISCPNCGTALKVNPFVIESRHKPKTGWQFWKK